MIIKRIESFSNEFVCFVKATGSDGLTGWGQTAPYHADITASVLHRLVAPHVLGETMLDLNALGDRVLEKEHKFPGAFLRRALAGVDTALWDLRAKAENKPVCALIGGTPGKVRAYASSMKRDITPEAEAERFAQLQKEQGFDAFKFRVGAECGRDVDHWPGRTESIVPEIRRALGDEVELLVDANSGFSPARAIEVGHMLEANGVAHFEEPCPYWEYEQTRQVANALTLDVTGGEQDCELQNWRLMIAMRAVNIVQPDICYLGGLSRTLAVAQMAHEAGIACTPHCANLSMVTLFTMHLLRAIPNAGKYLEFSIEGTDYYPWQEGLFVESPYEICNGMAVVTDKAGWGVEINPDWLAESQYQSSSL
ncbi:MAG: mandelate racemase/muconate lactonizing enzyme family protein [Granulosicoccus sp.]|nr:mandelate racemase/muconate lactonizing enzyme family protein [Granulosicoccus sp.]